MNEEKKVGYLMLLPSLVVMASVAFFPILFVLWLSLYRKLLIFNISRFVGLENYMFLARDDRFWRSLANTLYFTSVSVGMEFFLGLSIALLINREFRGRGWTRAIILVPWVVPTVVSAKMWEWMYNAEFGLFNYLLRYFGFFDPSVNWLGDKFWAIHAAILMDVWKTTPFVALLLTAGLQMIPQHLYQAARVDGASGWYILRRITLPLLKPVILVVLLFRSLDAFRVFDAVYVLTGGGPAGTTETLSIYAYKVLFQTLQFGYGSTIATAIFLGSIIMSLFYVRLLVRRFGR